MTVANLIYHKQAFWEIDYITHELCKDKNTKDLIAYLQKAERISAVTYDDKAN
jgi:hypothetical protein